MIARSMLFVVQSPRTNINARTISEAIRMNFTSRRALRTLSLTHRHAATRRAGTTLLISLCVNVMLPPKLDADDYIHVCEYFSCWQHTFGRFSRRPVKRIFDVFGSAP